MKDFWANPKPAAVARERSFLAAWQRRATERLIPILPSYLSPTNLTRLGFLGALIAASALVLCRWRIEYAALVPVGMTMNWFGASLDGPLAQHRKMFGPERGLSDHLTDLSSLLLVIVAYAFSPFLTFESAVIILACYLLFSAYTYIRAATGHVEQMALIGVGATEFRLMLALWPFAALALGVGGADTLTVAIGFLAFIAVSTLVIKIVVDARKIA